MFLQGMWKLTGAGVQSVNQADRALAAFVIIQAALKRSPRLRSYSLRDDLNSRMPNFQASCRLRAIVIHAAHRRHRSIHAICTGSLPILSCC